MHKAQKVDGDVVKVQNDDLGHQSTRAEQGREEPVEEDHQAVPVRVPVEATRLSRDHQHGGRNAAAATERMAGAPGAPGNGPQSRAPLPNSVLNRSRVPCSHTGYVTLLRFVRVILAHEKLTGNPYAYIPS